MAAAAPCGPPEVPPGPDWIHTDRPLRLADLRGRILILYMWTSG